VCKHTLEKKETKGGTDHDISLHERKSAAVAELASLINPHLSLIPQFTCVEESWASCRRLPYPPASPSAAVEPHTWIQQCPSCLCLQGTGPHAVGLIVGAQLTFPHTALHAQLSNKVHPEMSQGGPCSQK